jgi:hypothetical protein
MTVGRGQLPPACHSRESGNPLAPRLSWTPAFAGVTEGGPTHCSSRWTLSVGGVVSRADPVMQNAITRSRTLGQSGGRQRQALTRGSAAQRSSGLGRGGCHPARCKRRPEYLRVDSPYGRPNPQSAIINPQWHRPIKRAGVILVFLPTARRKDFPYRKPSVRLRCTRCSRSGVDGSVYHPVTYAELVL